MNKNMNFGVVGLSGRGSGMLREFLGIKGVKVLAVCDKYEDRAQHGVEIVKEATGKSPDKYINYKEMLERKDIGAILCFTTWITHSRIAIDSMRAGKNVCIEVGGAASEEECWQMVRASEETGKFCMLLENCCYGREELALYNMVRKGLFGELIYCTGGYGHDLRDEICRGREIRHGRLDNFINRNGELYPTHQLGPIAKLLNINRGNRFLSLTSMSTKSRGLHKWVMENRPNDDFLTSRVFEDGDVTTTMIKCAHGENIVLVHDCSNPRPYSRNTRIQGTKGIFMEDNRSVYFDNVSPKRHEWEPFEPYMERYEHPIWWNYKEKAAESGHGGMDFLVLSAFADAAINETKPPIDVYDTAAWMSITYLSEQSIAMGSMPVPVPDFTCGMWIDREPVIRGEYCLDEVCEEFFVKSK